MEYWERELIQTLLEMPPSDCCDVLTLSKRSGISQHDIIEALAQPGSRFEELKIVVWKRTGYEVDVKSVESLQVRQHPYLHKNACLRDCVQGLLDSRW